MKSAIPQTPRKLHPDIKHNAPPMAARSRGIVLVSQLFGTIWSTLLIRGARTQKKTKKKNPHFWQTKLAPLAFLSELRTDRGENNPGKKGTNNLRPVSNKHKPAGFGRYCGQVSLRIRNTFLWLC